MNPSFEEYVVVVPHVYVLVVQKYTFWRWSVSKTCLSPILRFFLSFACLFSSYSKPLSALFCFRIDMYFQSETVRMHVLSVVYN